MDKYYNPFTLRPIQIPLKNLLTAAVFLFFVECVESSQLRTEDISDAEEISTEDGSISDSTVDNQNISAILCNGSKAASFYIASRSGMITLGQAMMIQNGYFTIIDGECGFWVYTIDGIAYEGTLSEEERKMIEERFRIATWTNWSGSYQDLGCSDGAVFVASHNGERIYVNPSCGGVEELEWLFDARNKTQEQLIEKGTASTGSIRYCLVYDAAAVESTVPDLLQYQNAPQWPLSSNPADLAMYEGEDSNSRIDLSYLATGDEARLLRELRQAFLNGEIGKTVEFIPIEQPDGGRYQLYVRDSIPLEDENGNIAFDWSWSDAEEPE